MVPQWQVHVAGDAARCKETCQALRLISHILYMLRFWRGAKWFHHGFATGLKREKLGVGSHLRWPTCQRRHGSNHVSQGAEAHSSHGRCRAEGCFESTAQDAQPGGGVKVGFLMLFESLGPWIDLQRLGLACLKEAVPRCTKLFT